MSARGRPRPVAPRLPLSRVLDRLEQQHGRLPAAIPRAPLEWILWENVAYLVDDARRERAYRTLAKRAGLTAERIAAAPAERLLEATKLGGMHPEARVDRLKEIAEIALEHGGGDLSQVLALEPKAARKVLKSFPSIGAPGAEKILMHCGASDALALESNGLRVLVRLGFGREGSSYAATYRSALSAVEPELVRTKAALVRAHQLLRTHGQSTCKRSVPDCDACPLADGCPSASV
jgi:endonuclease III